LDEFDCSPAPPAASPCLSRRELVLLRGKISAAGHRKKKERGKTKDRKLENDKNALFID
jgi:hypothetical protein